MEKQRREREFSHAPQVTRMPDFEKLHRKEMRRKLMHETSREVTWFSRFCSLHVLTIDAKFASSLVKY